MPASAVAIFLFITLAFGGAIYLMAKETSEHRSVERQCLEQGFPSYQATGPMQDRRYFCQRRVLGTDEVREVKP